MTARGLLPDFSPAALAEANALAVTDLSGGEQVRDLRERPWVSIDDDDSRDLDQLSLAEPLDGGAARLLVAIADVEAAVRPADAIDVHARANTTSVYTAAQIFPMLPERLSTDLTSLGAGRRSPGAGRGDDGRGRRPGRAVRRLSGTGAQPGEARLRLGRAPGSRALDPRRPPPQPGILAQLRLQDRVAQAMKALRHQRGALTSAPPRRTRCSTASGSPTCLGREEPGQGADRGLHDRGERRRPPSTSTASASRRCAASFRALRAGSASSSSRTGSASGCPRSASAPALQAFLTGDARSIRCAFRISRSRS